MFRCTLISCNKFLSTPSVSAPATIIRSKGWKNPGRLVRQKMLFFSFGLDQQALRRTAVIVSDRERTRAAMPETDNIARQDSTGFKRSRDRQLQLWRRRIQYQEWYLEHMFTRHAWGLLRKYPPGGTKILGKADDGYFGYGHSFHQYNGTPLPYPAREVYERRKL